MDKVLKGQATPEQIAEWKAKYGTIGKYETEDGKVGYVKLINRDTYSAAAAKISTSPAKFTEIIIENCWVGGDEEIRTNDRYYFGLIDFVEEMMAKKKGTLTWL